MHVDEVLCHGENGGAAWETSHRDCIMRKVVSKEVTAGERSDFFWTLLEHIPNKPFPLGFLQKNQYSVGF